MTANRIGDLFYLFAMNRMLQRLIERNAHRHHAHRAAGDGTYSDYAIAKAYHRLRTSTISSAKDVFLTLCGIFSAAFAIEGFLLPAGFIDGGATGIALLGTILSPLPLWLLLGVVNAPFIYIAYRLLGKDFALRTIGSITVLAFVTATVHFPEVTHDKLLVAIFGGFFLGAGIGLSVRGGSVIDGTEVLAITLSRLLHVTMGDVITMINILIFSVVAMLLSIETAMYSLITYLAASRTMDFVIEGIEEYMGVTIISPKHEEIQRMLTQEMGRGVTVYQGKRGYRKGGGSYEVDIIYCVITRLELHKVTHEVEKIDPNAFLVMSSVKDTKGGIVKRRRLH